MRPYAQYCPIAKAAEVLGERWSLLILRDLLPGRRRFNELVRGLPGLSRALLTKRLRQLERAGLIERDADGAYVLTEAGAALEPVIVSLGEWGAQHAFPEPDPEELAPEVLLWWISGYETIDRACLPARVVTLQFDFDDHPHRFWLVCEPRDMSVCYTDPGFEVDVVVRSDVATLYKAWLGNDSVVDAVREQRIRLDGTPTLVRSFPRWFGQGPLAHAFAGRPADA